MLQNRARNAFAPLCIYAGIAGLKLVFRSGQPHPTLHYGRCLFALYIHFFIKIFMHKFRGNKNW